MRNENNQLVIKELLVILEVLIQIVALIKYKNLWLVVSILVSVVLLYMLFSLHLKCIQSVDKYEFIKFLFFGSEYNGFNFFPKLKLFMDYLEDKNDVEINTLEFECISNYNNRDSDITWIMKNVSNPTNEDINSYCLYTSSDFGKVNNVGIEVKVNRKPLIIDVNNVIEREGLRKTPFTFAEPIRPNEEIDEIRINMKMKNTFDPSHPEIIVLYPRNYGQKVKHIKIFYKTKETDKLNVTLHEIGKNLKGKKGYADVPIRSCAAEIDGEMIQYCFFLNGNEININNLYYLLITPLGRYE